MDSSFDATLKVSLDVVLLIIVGIPILVFKFGVSPFHRGFFCDDESIAHPLKEETISTAVLATVSLGLPMLSMLLAELFIYKRSLNVVQLEARAPSIPEYTLFGRAVHPYLASIYKCIGALLIGAAICQSTTDLMKYSIGRLRPHFLAVCQPDWSLIQCTDAQGFMQYVEEAHCTGIPDDIEEARLSHPSGHASISMYCMLYLTFYIQSKLTWRGSRLLRHFLQVVIIYMAIYCCMSRISDYKHHWSDVLGGAILGVTISLLTVLYISSMFSRTALHIVARKLNELHKWMGGKDGTQKSYELYTNEATNGPSNEYTLETPHAQNLPV